MGRPVNRAVILGAGFGSRMQPITSQVPKPLIPFMGISSLELALWRLNDHLGIQDVMINTHHLHQKVVLGIESIQYTGNISTSFESPSILGTAGAFAPMKKWRNGHPILVINGDVISNLSWQDLIDSHMNNKAFATVALRPTSSSTGRRAWLKHGKIVGFSSKPIQGATPYGFACAHILSEGFLELLDKSNFFDIIDVYNNEIESGKVIIGVVENSFWFDLGTPDDFFEAHKQFFKIWKKSARSLENLGVYSCLQKQKKVLKKLVYKEGELFTCEQVPQLITIKGLNFLFSPLEATSQCVLQNSILMGQSKISSQELVKNQIIYDNLRLNISPVLC